LFDIATNLLFFGNQRCQQQLPTRLILFGGMHIAAINHRALLWQGSLLGGMRSSGSAKTH
jgi:hypothetical protein